MKLPTSLHGWIVLFWLTFRRCPFCHGPLVRDFALYDDGESAYCFKCEGVLVLPRGFFNALVWNERAAVTAAQKVSQEGESH